MKFILGTKEKMTQIFDESGKVQPVTAIKAGPVTVTQIKNKEKDGYTGVQVGFGQKKKGGKYSYIREFRLKKDPEVKVGDDIDLSIFEKGDKVTVASTTKGKGFQGGVKRHNFAGGPRTHGQKHTERAPGSIGATGPQRVFKGTKMAGRMGSNRVTVKNLQVVELDKENGKIYIKGAMPGIPGSLVEIKA